jgi:Secretion system C-terminal sorting domain
MTGADILLQLTEIQLFVFWHLFHISSGITRNPNQMKSNSTLLTLALIAAFLVANIIKVSAQDVPDATAASSTPMLLLSFTGASQGTVANLQWATENETSSKWFVIERSGATGGYDSIGVVLGINNDNETNYSFTDDYMLSGNNYYRLREVDMNGVVRYSTVVTLSSMQISTKMEVYPNPAVASISFSVPSAVPQSVIVQVYNMTGVMVIASQQQLVAGNNLETLTVANLKAGNYILKVASQDGSSQFVQSFVKIN